MTPALQRRLTLAGALAACLISTLALAQGAYPNRPVTLIVPYPAGGANDAVGRLIGQKMGENLGQNIVVDGGFTLRIGY